MKIVLQILVLCIVLAMMGCASMPSEYRPNTVGSLEDADLNNEIEVSISTRENTAYIGRPIVFNVSIKNIGTHPLWIPRNPDLLFTWIYSNGRHDNFLREFEPERYYSKHDSVLLRPGQQMIKSVTIKTYYFLRPGITEFRAVLHASRNTNPKLAPFWHGKIESNAYGVLVEKGSKKKLERYESMTKLTFNQ